MKARKSTTSPARKMTLLELHKAIKLYADAVQRDGSHFTQLMLTRYTNEYNTRMGLK